jgi:excisionase family DNA binding protein
MSRRKRAKSERRERLEAKRAAADVMSLEDVAARLGIGRNQAYNFLQQGKIPALRFGRRWLIPRAAFDRLLSGEPQQQPT